MKTSTSWVLFFLALALTGAAVSLERQHATRQALALDRARRQTLRLRRLTEENRQLTGKQLTPESRSRLEAEHGQLEALRGRVAALQKELAGNEAGEAGGPVPARDWTYAGRASPMAAFESVLWAASHGEVDRLAGLLDFGAEAHSTADALFEQLPAVAQGEYGSAQKVIATLVAGNFPKDASAMTLLRGSESKQDAQLTLRLDHGDGTSTTNIYRFQQAEDGWKLLVPASVMAGYQRALVGEPSASENSPP